MQSKTQSRSIQALLGQWRPGHCLPGRFYTRSDVFEADLRLLESRWIYAGHVSELAEAGDWLTAELGAESAIVARGEDGVIRAMANVCRHRGSRVCVGARGHATLITCPYHAWTYHLDGRLRAAREMPRGFDPAGHGLTRLPIRIVGGLIFVSFEANPPGFEEAGAALEAMTTLHGWAGARIAERRSYRVAANWKLVMENYHECYHCGPAHPEFSVLHALARPGARTLSSEPDPATGLSDFEAWGPRADGWEVARVMRSALAEGCLTGSADGQPLAPPMGPAGARWDGSCVFGELGFLSAFLAYADHGVIYRFIPRGVLDTEMEVIWLVAGDAEAGRDYDPERLTWLWDVTSQADKRIIECNQAGVSSRAYQPGPFSLMEPGTQAYVERYVAELSATFK
jgi:Rieske 2Fe-2S family protein